MVCTHAAADRASPHRLPVRWASQARAKWRFGLGGNIRRNHCPRGLRRWSWSWSWGGGGDGGWRQYGCRRWQEEEITRELRGARVHCVSAVWVRGRCTVAWSMLRTHVYTVYTCYARDASAAHVPNELKVTVHSGAGLLATAKHHSTRSVTYTARACGSVQNITHPALPSATRL